MQQGRAQAIVAAFAVVASLAAAPAARAAELITNGGFESGLAGWTVANQVGGAGDFYLQTGATSPANGFAVASPPEGSNAAMTDQTGPGSHVLYQDFTLAAPTASATLSFRVYVNNAAGTFFTPATLDFGGDANQQARVDILAAGADPFSVGLADVLLNAFQTLVGDPAVSGYTLFSIDITALLNAHVGEALRLRFAEVDNQLFFNFGVDDVRITTGRVAVPEPATMWLALVAVLGLALQRRGSLRAS